jgi:hypothetical protein
VLTHAACLRETVLGKVRFKCPYYFDLLTLYFGAVVEMQFVRAHKGLMRGSRQNTKNRVSLKPRVLNLVIGMAVARFALRA